MQRCHSARNRVSKKREVSKLERGREDKTIYFISCSERTSFIFAESAAPLMGCSGCQLLDVTQFCSIEVYRRLVQVMREEQSKFYFQPDKCLATAAGRNFSSTSPDCIPPPQGLQPSGMGNRCLLVCIANMYVPWQLVTVELSLKDMQQFDDPCLQ